ncbi:hypothetical protein KCU81_g84, partial [Aureobasidium melanogenum]
MEGNERIIKHLSSGTSGSDHDLHKELIVLGLADVKLSSEIGLRVTLRVAELLHSDSRPQHPQSVLLCLDHAGDAEADEMTHATREKLDEDRDPAASPVDRRCNSWVNRSKGSNEVELPAQEERTMPRRRPCRSSQDLEPRESCLEALSRAAIMVNWVCLFFEVYFQIVERTDNQILKGRAGTTLKEKSAGGLRFAPVRRGPLVIGPLERDMGLDLVWWFGSPRLELEIREEDRLALSVPPRRDGEVLRSRGLPLMAPGAGGS